MLGVAGGVGAAQAVRVCEVLGSALVPGNEFTLDGSDDPFPH